MYTIDFFRNIFKRNNWGVLIWLVLNTLIVTGVLGSCFGGNPDSYVKGAAIYVCILVASLSPLGEWMLRVQNGCEKITRKDYLDRLMPLFNEVYVGAKAKNPELPDNIQLYMIDSGDANAFATGRKTVCITRGLLRYPDQQIKAILAHEFGHLAHKDTDAILIISVGNLLVSIIFILFRIVFKLISCFVAFGFAYISESMILGFMAGIVQAAMDIYLCFIMRLWTKFGALLCLRSSRMNENLADQYSYELGYGEFLCAFLDGLPPSQDTGLWAILNASHPTSDSRIGYLQQLGCTYM